MIPRRAILAGVGSGLALSALAKRAGALERSAATGGDTFAVLGTGRFGGALGKRLGSLGYRVVYGSRAPKGERVRALVNASGARASAASHAEAVSRAGIVVFALPWEPVKDLLPALGDLTGKLVLDPMNAKPKIVERYPFPSDPQTSVAEQLQSAIPGAHVVKVFNTILYADLADPARAGGPISIPLAGADPGAKERVAQLVSALGLDPVDIGPLVAARYLEHLLWLEVGYIEYNKGKKLFEIYLRPVPV